MLTQVGPVISTDGVQLTNVNSLNNVNSTQDKMAVLFLGEQDKVYVNAACMNSGFARSGDFFTNKNRLHAMCRLRNGFQKISKQKQASVLNI